ncbi:MAG: PilZ domain-containing protein, partial [Actinomycetota bacterium]
YYRAQLNVPARVIHGSERLEVTLVNISLGGAAVSIKKQLNFGAPVTICFSLPETDTEARVQGQIVWSNNEGQHGIQFAETDQPIRTTLQGWLHSQMKKDNSGEDFEENLS